MDQVVSTRWDALDRGEGPSGVLWSHAGGELDVNIVDLAPGARVEAHRNDDVDVLVVVLQGDGMITVDGASSELVHAVVHVRAGAVRAVTAGPSGLRYVSAHRHRDRLTPTRRPHG